MKNNRTFKLTAFLLIGISLFSFIFLNYQEVVIDNLLSQTEVASSTIKSYSSVSVFQLLLNLVKTLIGLA